MKNETKITIVIPTMNYNYTKKCVDSILKYTDLNNVKIIIIVNTDNIETHSNISGYTRQLSEECEDIKSIHYYKALGAVKALNAGIKHSKNTDFVLLLNDDCEIMESEKNYWLTSLLEPFENNPKMGCTGPYRMPPIFGECKKLNLSNDDIEFGFILFFCALIPKLLFHEIGLLDESLNCGVDLDFCLKLRRAGYDIQQVPEKQLEVKDGRCYGTYPIFHQAEGTVHDFYGIEKWHDMMKEDQKILEDRYGVKNKKEFNISVVIPVYGNEKNLIAFKNCWKSIFKNINFNKYEKIEFIFIANGCIPETKDFLNDISETLKEHKIKNIITWDDSALGATGALNKGIRLATGDIIILLNQDVTILDYGWIEMLINPFYGNQEVGITGPIKGVAPALNCNFILFFCAAIHRKVFDKIGLLDEIFNPGGYEDIDFSIRALRSGFELLQVPVNESIDHDGSMFHSSFPIYHIENHNSWMTNEVKERNNNIIFERYVENKERISERNKIEITWPVAQKKYELEMIQEFLKKYKIKNVLEIGTYRGGTARLWANMLDDENGHVYCCDKQFDWGNFKDNGYIGTENKEYNREVYNGTNIENKIVEFKGDSHDSEFIKNVKNNITEKVDILFIDGDHTYEGVKQDFINYYDLVKENGFIIFHDIVDSKHHRDYGCVVSILWNEIKNLYPSWEFIDNNEYPGCPYVSMGIGVIKKDSEKIKLGNYKTNINEIEVKPKITGEEVLCFIPTKNRYFTTLPLTIQSIISQTVKPDKLMIYDDNDDDVKKDLRENETYYYLFNMLNMYNIKWEYIFGSKKGQHFGHQQANKSNYKFVWRVDDDQIAMPDTLEKLLSHMKDDVGAVGGVILTKGFGGDDSPKLKDIFSKANVQWNYKGDVLEVDHLHSSFLYRSNIVDYCLELSPVAHREETLFSHELQEKGYKLIVDRSIVTHHLRQSNSGIRSNNIKWFYDHDEKIFIKKMEEWGYKIITLDCGLGDHLAFLNILPQLKMKWKNLIIGVCFPEVFKDQSDVTIVSVGHTKPIKEINIYQWMTDNKWDRSLIEAFARCYDVNY